MNRVKKVLLLGSGALQIGQAGEFDYSGSQAIKALKEEGVKVILINPNIATIQTSQGFADQIYFLPVEPHFVEEIIKAEKPDGILLSFGGQTALNCGLALVKSGVLTKYRVRVLGTPIKAIQITEDRHQFAQTLKSIDLLIPKSKAAKSLVDATLAAKIVGYPVIVRAAFSLGGQDSQVCFSQKELERAATRALSKSPQILIEEYLEGWKEVEYEVVRDRFDNCITVCNMENVDPMGIHTGESIVVAPSQTLNNFEYHTLREIAIKVIRHLQIVGECNIQFALNPRPPAAEPAKNSHLEPSMNNSEKAKGKNGRASTNDYLDYRIIEVNARLSRSSALASKATGYPLAYVAAKLALGYGLTEIKNSVTKKTIACFEPALDYLVVKIPRWDLGKFVKSQNQIGPSMQSVGEVMAIGRKFEEAIQKATRMLDIDLDGILDEKAPSVDYARPTPWRIFAVAKAIKNNVPIKTIYQKTSIDPFFLEKIKNIAKIEKSITSSQSTTSTTGIKKARDTRGTLESRGTLLIAKQHGFSDKRLATLTNSTESKIRELRKKLQIHPSVKQIDTLAAEYPAETNYLYLTYNGDSDDIDLNPKSAFRLETRSRRAIRNPKQIQNTNDKNSKRFEHSNLENSDLFRASNFDIRISQNNKIIVLGSGPYRIGSSVEFDWCSVTCAQTVSRNDYDPIIINCNPETVSTDYDMASRLYFEELTTETVLEIYEKEKPRGVIVSMGGQTPNNLVMDLTSSNVKILGTSPESIDQAEDRNKFSSLCDNLAIDQPLWAKLKSVGKAVKFAQNIGFPVLVRPSYVLSGTAMNAAFSPDDLKSFLNLASHISREYPVVISKFHENAKEIEIDAVAHQGNLLTYAISEHIENAGVHSGDSTMVLPAQKIYLQTEKQITKIAQKIAKSLKITGPFNIQFLARDNKVMVIECNLRASRSFPFVSKVMGINFVKVATEAILNQLSVHGSPRFAKAPRGEQFTEKIKSVNRQLTTDNLSYVGVKAPQFSFSRVRGADPILRVEMTSTGEVACFGKDVAEAFLKSIISTGVKLPKKSVFLSLAGEENKMKFLPSAKLLAGMGLKIYATAGTSAFLKSNGIAANMLYKIHEHKKPNVLDYLLAKKIDLVINIVDPYFKREFDDDYLIRRATIDYGVPILTNMQTAELFAKAIFEKSLSDLKPLPWSAYVVHRN